MCDPSPCTILNEPHIFFLGVIAGAFVLISNLVIVIFVVSSLVSYFKGSRGFIKGKSKKYIKILRWTLGIPTLAILLFPIINKSYYSPYKVGFMYDYEIFIKFVLVSYFIFF